MGKSVNSAFFIALTSELNRNLMNFYGSENWDVKRFGPYKESIKNWILRQLNRLTRKIPGRILILDRADIDYLTHHLAKMEETLNGLSSLYELLQDEYSKSLLVKIIAYQILGYRKVKLPLAWSRERNAEEKFENSLLKSSKELKTTSNSWILKHYDLHKAGYPIECFLHSPSAFTLRQYEYKKCAPSCMAMPGDFVIDGGGCWGDTALYFSHLVGERGKVFSFEFVPENLTVFQRNLDLNPQLAQRIQIVPSALYNRSGFAMDYTSQGPSTRPVEKASDKSQHNQSVSTLTIDDFVQKESLERVDFIKMDIEGSELNALRGAERTLRTFRPKLAICLYHSIGDFIQIPKYLDELRISYEFFLDHFTIHREETILFANPVSR